MKRYLTSDVFERRGSFDVSPGVLLLIKTSLSRYDFSPSPCTVLHGWAGAVQEGFILQHRKHGKEAWEGSMGRKHGKC